MYVCPHAHAPTCVCVHKLRVSETKRNNKLGHGKASTSSHIPVICRPLGVTTRVMPGLPSPNASPRALKTQPGGWGEVMLWRGVFRPGGVFSVPDTTRRSLDDVSGAEFWCKLRSFRHLVVLEEFGVNFGALPPPGWREVGGLGDQPACSSIVL